MKSVFLYTKKLSWGGEGEIASLKVFKERRGKVKRDGE